MSHFIIRCRNCGKELREVYCAFCEHCKDSLLITDYKDRFRNDLGSGIWRFNWLPIHNHEFEQPGPVVYKSEGLAGYLGLKNLFIAFNGYWPERGANLQTCTFKEFEAAVVLQNAMENGVTGLVVASAGNTARAFAHLSTIADFPVIIVVPKMCLKEMWYIKESLRTPTLAVMDGDYADSIDVAKTIASTLGMPFEGGVKNIAKRDGLGIVLLEAVSVIGRLPDHYFQAVGSGTGAIGVWEMSERFIKDGRFGNRLPRLHLAQNYPFVPMVKAWQGEKRELNLHDLRPELIGEITTRVLSTRYPAYSVKGGIYDALKSTGGIMYAVINEEVYQAMELFEKIEGIDIVPASGVALGALVRAIKERNISKDETILLNITGGGEKRILERGLAEEVRPLLISRDISEEEIEEKLCCILKKN